MIPASLDSAWEVARDADRLVQRYRDFFACLDWSVVPECDPQRPWPGSPPHPRAAYLKALLVKLVEGKRYITDLRAFLVEHPLLVLELGFRPVLDPSQPYGFDVDRTVPGERWLRHQQSCDPAVLGDLLAGTVHALQAETPESGATVAVDVQHIFAWVGTNNPKRNVPHRFDATRQPAGDPDCRLGVKERANQGTRRVKDHVWGYGTSLVSTIDAVHGDVVLANHTQPFNRQDVTYFHPVHDAAIAALGRHPAKLRELVALRWSEAGKYKVLPLDGSIFQRLAAERPQLTRNRSQYVYFPDLSVVPFASAPKVFNRPHSITADVTIPDEGAEGVLLAQGGVAGGYAFYIKDGKLHYVHNYLGLHEYRVSTMNGVPTGRSELRYEFEPTGKPDMAAGKGSPGRGQLYVNGKLGGNAEFEMTVPIIFGVEGLSCGYDFGEEVTHDYHMPFRFSGTLHKVTVDVSGDLIQDEEAETRVLMARQ